MIICEEEKKKEKGEIERKFVNWSKLLIRKWKMQMNFTIELLTQYRFNLQAGLLFQLKFEPKLLTGLWASYGVSFTVQDGIELFQRTSL